ncbi:hypothetical protein AbraIFM66950_005145 [Aspergillus brasiliensis]|nr:hypothetical protein AbraIFM66950_005145 [Aspergillus brasiliensis]
MASYPQTIYPGPAYPGGVPFGPHWDPQSLRMLFFTGARLRMQIIEQDHDFWQYFVIPPWCHPDDSYKLPWAPRTPQLNVTTPAVSIPNPYPMDSDSVYQIPPYGFQRSQYMPVKSLRPRQHMPQGHHSSHMSYPGYQVHQGGPPQPSRQSSVQAQAGPSQYEVAKDSPKSLEVDSRDLSPVEDGSDIVPVNCTVNGKVCTDENAQDLLPLEACIFVGNLPSALHPTQIQSELKRVFSKHGRCFVKVKTNPKTGLKTAFAQFETSDAANIVIQKSNDQPSAFELHQRPLRFEMARGKKGPANGTNSLRVPQPVPSSTRGESREGSVEPAHIMNGEASVEPAHKVTGESSVKPTQDDTEVNPESGKSAKEIYKKEYL